MLGSIIQKKIIKESSKAFTVIFKANQAVVSDCSKCLGVVVYNWHSLAIISIVKDISVAF